MTSHAHLCSLDPQRTAGVRIFVSLRKEGISSNFVHDIGADFGYVDLQHGSQSYETGLDQLIAAPDDTPLWVRLDGQSASEIARLSRSGTAGFILPDVRGAAEIEQLRRATNATSHAPPLIAMIESPAGLAALDATLSSEGIVAVVIGCGDYLRSLSKPGDYGSCELRSAMETMFQKARQANRRAGIFGLGSAPEAATLFRDLEPDLCSIGSWVGSSDAEARERINKIRAAFD